MKDNGIDISKLKVNDIDQAVIFAFLEWLRNDRKNGTSTRNVRLAHLKSFFRYLMISAPEYSDKFNKILSIPFAKDAKRPPSGFSEEAVKTMPASIDSSTKEGLRHLAILSLLYDSGCRGQEVIDLDVSDFQKGRCCRIYVRGKGNK